MVLAQPLVFAQMSPGGAEGIVAFHQPGGVQGRRFRGQLFPRLLGLQPAVEQSAPFLLQSKFGLAKTVPASGQALLPGIHLVADHQGRIKALQVRRSP